PAQIRAAQPSGGLLSPENTATDGARETPTPESRSWAESSLAGAAQEAGAADETTSAGTGGKVNEDLVVLRGPGGFPLLGAVAVGHRRRIPGDAMAMPTSPGIGDGSDPRMVQDPGPIPKVGLMEAISAAEEEESLAGAEAWERVPFSVF